MTHSATTGRTKREAPAPIRGKSGDFVHAAFRVKIRAVLALQTGLKIPQRRSPLPIVVGQRTESAERIVLASRPVGEPTLDNFRLEETPIPHPGPGQLLLRTLWLSLDPYMRGRMSDAPSYAKPVGIGDVMEGGTVSEVVASNVPRFAKGDIVVGRTGWQTHALSDGSSLQKVEPTRAPVEHRTRRPPDAGYDRLHGLARDRQASRWRNRGGRGSFGCGRRVWLSARSPESRVPALSASRAATEYKCRYVTEELGFDACIDHRAPDFAARLAAVWPERYRRLFRECRRRDIRGRVPTAQSIRPHSGVRADLHVQRHLAVTRPDRTTARDASDLDQAVDVSWFHRLRLFRALWGFHARCLGLGREGRIKYREDVVEGLKNAPRALIGFLRGENFGKLSVRVAHASS